MTKQSDIEMVAKARAWAVKAHAGQKDKAGQDYFKAHVTVVAEGVKGDPIAEAVAFLHDTVEDTSVTIEDIRTGFPKEVADAVCSSSGRAAVSKTACCMFESCYPCHNKKSRPHIRGGFLFWRVYRPKN